MKNKMLSDRLNRIADSQTLEMSEKSKDLAAAGVNIIDLSLGQPDFPTPAHIKKAAIEAIENNFTVYTQVQGYPELRHAICMKLKRENNLTYASDQIVVSTGAKQSLANIILSLVNPGDEVIIPTPYWVSYKELVNLANGVCVFVKAGIEHNFKVTAEQIEKAITPKTKLLLYSSPCNPSGAVYSYDELKAIAKVLERHPHVFIISDEIYEHLNYVGKHESIAQFDEIIDRVIIINGVSKAYAMTGWRIGYSASPKWLADASKKLQGQITSNPCSISQKATYTALLSGNECVDEMVVAFKRRRDLLVKLLSEIPHIKSNSPDGAFYCLPDTSYFYGKEFEGRKINNSYDLSIFLLEKAHIATVSGEAFGSPECIRLSYSLSDEQIVESMKRLKAALALLK